jgi:predicted CoA-substrate-specific enzyme activase
MRALVPFFNDRALLGSLPVEFKRNIINRSCIMSFFVAGIDLGSLSTKSLIMESDGENRIVSYHIIQSGAAYKGAAEKVMDESLKKAGLKMKDLKHIISTGYGRESTSFSSADVTEITCHARGAKQIFPDVHTVIDIGGQDSKVIQLNDHGQVINFAMNDKCAAGTGRFLEVMSSALEIELEEFGAFSLRARNKLEVSSMCTVFAESEVISLKAQGHPKEDIASAIHHAIARRVAGMAGKKGRWKERVVMSGGVAKNIGVVKALEKQLDTSLLIPDEPQIIGALGAALIAAERADQANKENKG